ncbi:polysaccharide pyruvyl transferase family protein, partial [Winogradskyella sp.]|nr:polysaccharide pyruvyl transferase family protein [Winogradskyella sp.]
EVLEKTYYQYFPKYPTIINFNANDICNSKCTMCNIWKQEPTYEVTPNDLKNIFSDKLYKEIRHIGITGGEPTLRDDLPSLFEAACLYLPKVVGLSMITNAIKESDVKSQIKKCKAVCDKYNKTFSVMVSLDGYGDTHDKVRGSKGNFETAVNVINFLKYEDINFSIGSTISKLNVWDIDDLLIFLKEENISGRFRVAEFINRLYNNNRGKVIRNFTDEEVFHLSNFFNKLIYTFEKQILYKNTYKNIINMLNGGQRQVSCPYKTDGLVLGSRGEISYCAPKSPILGNVLKTSSFKLYKNKINKRRKIVKSNCKTCIHDYHSTPIIKQKIKEYKRLFFEKLISIKGISKIKYFSLLRYFYPTDSKLVFITGWFGTETVGDKAILAQIVSHFKEINKDFKFCVSSITPYLTEKTIKELGIEAEVIDTASFDFIKFSIQAKYVVMGGGPLMDMEELALPYWAFGLAFFNKNEKIVFGNGLGPLNKYTNIVKDILEKADEIWLRDQKSIDLARTLVPEKNMKFYGDPAKRYINDIKDNILPYSKKENYFSVFVRDWTREYKGDLDESEFMYLKNKFDKNLSFLINRISEHTGLTPFAYPMHTFVIGQDDRDYFRYLKINYLPELEFHKYNSSVNEAVSVMKGGKFTIAMRFHSVLFAHTLGVNFIPIDYTNGGKISAFLNDENFDKPLANYTDFANYSEKEIDNLIKLYLTELK